MEPDGSVAVVHGGVAVTVGSEVIGERRGLGGHLPGHLPGPAQVPARRPAFLADLAGSEAVFGGQTWSMKKDGVAALAPAVVAEAKDQYRGNHVFKAVNEDHGPGHHAAMGGGYFFIRRRSRRRGIG